MPGTPIERRLSIPRASASRSLILGDHPFRTVHATIEGTFGPFLDQIEALNKEYPVNNLRWAFAHMDQVTAVQLGRMLYDADAAVPATK